MELYNFTSMLIIDQVILASLLTAVPTSFPARSAQRRLCGSGRGCGEAVASGPRTPQRPRSVLLLDAGSGREGQVTAVAQSGAGSRLACPTVPFRNMTMA